MAGGSSNVDGERRAGRRTAHSRRIDESLAYGFRSFLPIPVGSVLALDTTRRPWHGSEAFWADRQLALNTDSKAAVVNPTQCGFYLTQQAGLSVHVSHRQISFRRILNPVSYTHLDVYKRQDRE